MNNYQGTNPSPFNQKERRFHGSTLESIRFRNGIRHYTVKRRTNERSNFLNFIIWNIAFFSLFPLVSASVASFVDKNYESQKEDLYDALLNTFFPIYFVILLNVSGEPGSIKNVLLPLLDDVLYNTITWIIPLIVSFSYDDLMGIKIFSIVNMCLHLICAVIAIISWKRVAVVMSNSYFIHNLVLLFLIFFPVVVIPIFWMIIITIRHAIDSIAIIFLTLFGICLVSFILFMYILIRAVVNAEKLDGIKMFYTVCIICFYVPNILQT